MDCVLRNVIACRSGGVAGDRIRWLEDTVPIEAEVVTPGRTSSPCKIAGQNREQRLTSRSTDPYTCPDMPK
jgi:hypothetical protein